MSAPHDAIWRRLDERLYDAPTLRRWFWSLEAEDPHMADPIAWGKLDCLRHRVLEAMSGCLPSSPVPLARIKPTKRRDELGDARIERERVDNPEPVVLMGKPEGGEAKLKDGNHRFYAAKDAGRETLPAVWVDPEPVT